jgi:hypothetical protein
MSRETAESCIPLYTTSVITDIGLQLVMNALYMAYLPGQSLPMAHQRNQLTLHVPGFGKGIRTGFAAV